MYYVYQVVILVVSYLGFDGLTAVLIAPVPCICLPFTLPLVFAFLIQFELKVFRNFAGIMLSSTFFKD